MSNGSEIAFWNGQEGSGTTIISQGDHIITLNLVGNDPWVRPGWITLDGLNYFDVALSTLSSAIQRFLSPDNGILVMSCQIFFDSTDDYSGVTNNTMVPTNIGANTGVDNLVQQRLNTPGLGGGLTRARCRDGVAAEKDMSGGNNGTRFNTEDVFTIVVDNRSPQKQCYFFRNRDPKTGDIDLTTLGDINFSGSSNERLRLGASAGSGGGAEFGFVSQIRNWYIQSFPTPPKGLDNLLQERAENNGVPKEFR